MSKLFSPLYIKDIELRNRIVVSPMCQYSASDGFATDWHLVHLGSRAVGGAGLVVVEATAVSPEGRISPDDLGLWKNEHIEKLKSIVSFIESQGAVAGIQLAHAGRKASIASEWKGGKLVRPDKGGWQPVAPSSIPFTEEYAFPRELAITEISKIISCFVTAAGRAVKAGFKVLEIHAAHGYLIHEFLSPLSNQREDEYGGSFGRRISLLEEVIDGVKTVWPENYPLFVRISATDWVEDGWDIEQSVKLAGILKQKGVDLIDVSSGGLVPHAHIPVEYGYQLPLARRVRNEAGISVGAVGMLTDPVQMETILQNDGADLIFIGREFLRDPYFPLHAARRLGEDIKWPVQYGRSK